MLREEQSDSKHVEFTRFESNHQKYFSVSASVNCTKPPVDLPSLNCHMWCMVAHVLSEGGKNEDVSGCESVQLPVFVNGLFAKYC